MTQLCALARCVTILHLHVFHWACCIEYMQRCSVLSFHANNSATDVPTERNSLKICVVSVLIRLESPRLVPNFHSKTAHIKATPGRTKLNTIQTLRNAVHGHNVACVCHHGHDDDAHSGCCDDRGSHPSSALPWFLRRLDFRHCPVRPPHCPSYCSLLLCVCVCVCVCE